MSRTALLGLLLLALGIAVFVRCSSRAERRVLSEPVPEPGPASPGQEPQALSPPAPLAEAAETRAPSPAEPAIEVPALVGPLGASVRVTDPEGRPLASASVSVSGDQEVTLFAGRTAHDFELRPGLEVAGVVVDHATGAPLAGVSIGEAGGWATSDDAGRFRLLAGGTGTTILYCELEGYCGLQIPVALGAPEPVRFAMVRSTSLAGRTRDAEGRGLAGVKVFASANPADEDAELPRELGLPPEWRWYSNSERREAVSDAEGGFTLAGLLPFQAQVWVSASCKGFRPTSTVVATGAPGETGRWELVLEPESSLGTIHGRLTLNGEPARATVHWKGPTRVGHAWARDGEYRLAHVEPGHVALSVRLDGGRALGNPRSGHEAGVEVTPGSVLEQDFALTLAMAEISGSVRFEDGTPARGVGVEFQYGAGESTTTTGEDGLYAYAVPLQDKEYLLVVRFGGQSWIKRGVAAGTSGVDFVLPLFGELRYRAIEAGTRLSLRGFWAHWRRPGEKDYRWLGEPALTPDASGWLHAPVPLGPIELLASTDNHHWAFATGVVIGPDTEHVFEFVPGHTLVFELDPVSGAWPADHELVVVEPEAAPSIAARVSPDGQCQWTYGDRFAPGRLESRRLDFAANARVSLSGLVGRQLLLVFPDDLVLEPAELEVDGPPPDPITVRWRRR